MIKHLIALFALAPVLCFGDSSFPYKLQSLAIFKFTNTSGSSQQSTIQSVNLENLEGYENIQNYIYAYTARQSIGFSCPIGNVSSVPSLNSSLSTSALSSTRPFQVVTTNNEVFTTGWGLLAPDVHALYSTLARLYLSGYRNYDQIFVSASSIYLNFTPNVVISDVLTGTNTPLRATVLSALSQINNALQGISSGIQNIRIDLGQFQTDYQSVNSLALNPSSFTYDSIPSIGGSDFNYAVDSVLQSPYYSDSFKSLLASSLGSVYSDFVSQAVQMYQLDQSSPGSPGYGKTFNDYLTSPGSVGSSRNYHYSTPLTNEMRRMTLDWSRDTTNQLARNTANITNQLQQWKRELHDDVDNIGVALGSVITDGGGQNSVRVDISGSSSPVHVTVDNLDIGVTLSGPVQLDATQFNAFSEDLGKAGDYMERLFNEFKWWAWDSPDSWKKGFLDRDFSRLSSNVQEQVSLQHSISNLLANFALNFTNNTEFAISNALAGFSFPSTNDYLLLSDYQSFIDSSKYNAVVSSLPDDLAAALSSFGFVDSSEYSGRWWVFQSANMALQSQLALTNAALSSTLLNALSAIDDSEDSGGSLLSRWLSLIDSIPDPEEIQQSLADATNIVSNIGFERADALYSTATQDLVSVVKGIYRDKSLPDNIRFVFIPAAQGREEKFVDIPVGEHSSLWSLFRSGMAFALSVVTLILFPKYVSWLVAHYTRLVERIIKSLHAYTHQ